MMNHRLHPRLLKFGATIALLVALLAFFARAASAQDTWSDTSRRAATPDSVLRLSLGDAIRLASHQNVQVEAARYRVREASARVTQRRADLLPQVSGVVTERGSTFNSAALFPI